MKLICCFDLKNTLANSFDDVVESDWCEIMEGASKRVVPDIRVQDNGRDENILIGFCPTFLETSMNPITDSDFDMRICVYAIEIAECKENMVKASCRSLGDICRNSKWFKNVFDSKYPLISKGNL